jgi:methylated-DNA-[protein]-cysteine S-methyltransferase
MKKSSLFTKAVFEYLRKVKRGQVITYGQLAQAIGRPMAARAVGNALNKNPYAPKVPCHRVIRSDGSLGGYSLGVKKKAELLKKEGIKIKNNKIIHRQQKNGINF